VALLNETRDIAASAPPGKPRTKVLRRAQRRGRRRRFPLRYAGVLAGTLLAWQIVASRHIFPSFAFPSPGVTYHAFVVTLTQGYLGSTLGQDLVISLWRVTQAYVGAVVVGVVLGVLMTQSRAIFTLVDPFLQFLRPIPPLAYIPLFIVWFGIGETPKVLLILVSTLPVIIISTIKGVKSTPVHRVELARNLGASRLQVLSRVVFPSALPDIFTGMKVAVGVAWSTLVAAELIAASQGLGWLIEEAGQQLQTGIVVTGIIVIGVMGYVMDLAIRFLERIVIPWRHHA
jgi:ABC-type nitrate/sulfonate/bicarbonate transport system permease component